PYWLHRRLRHTQDGHLGRVHDRRETAAAEWPQTRDGETGAFHLLTRQAALLGLVAQLGHFTRVVPERLLVGVADHRHHQSGRRCHRHTDVYVLLADELGPGRMQRHVELRV